MLRRIQVLDYCYSGKCGCIVQETDLWYYVRLDDIPWAEIPIDKSNVRFMKVAFKDHKMDRKANQKCHQEDLISPVPPMVEIVMKPLEDLDDRSIRWVSGWNYTKKVERIDTTTEEESLSLSSSLSSQEEMDVQKGNETSSDTSKLCIPPSPTQEAMEFSINDKIARKKSNNIGRKMIKVLRPGMRFHLLTPKNSNQKNFSRLRQVPVNGLDHMSSRKRKATATPQKV